jgi:hypothetical protein
VSDPRTLLVGAGYDAMADTWEEWSAQVTITEPERSVSFHWILGRR